MAHQKAKDPRQITCENAAIDVVLDWYKKQQLILDKNSMHVVWFGFMGYHSFKCMISSHIGNHFFEVTMNQKSGEVRCDCFTRFEYFVQPAKDSVPISFSNDIYSLI